MHRRRQQMQGRCVVTKQTKLKTAFSHGYRKYLHSGNGPSFWAILRPSLPVKPPFGGDFIITGQLWLLYLLLCRVHGVIAVIVRYSLHNYGTNPISKASWTILG